MPSPFCLFRYWIFFDSYTLKDFIDEKGIRAKLHVVRKDCPVNWCRANKRSDWLPGLDDADNK